MYVDAVWLDLYFSLTQAATQLQHEFLYLSSLYFAKSWNHALKAYHLMVPI